VVFPREMKCPREEETDITPQDPDITGKETDVTG
jgi:hypothetical protein